MHTYKRKGTNFSDMQSMNRSLIIKLIREKQECSRAYLSKATGLKQPSITNIINDLIDFGLVKETGLISGEKGRRSIGLTLDSSKYKVVGVKLSREYFSLGIFDISGKEYEFKHIDIDVNEGADIVLDKIRIAIQKVFKKHKSNSFIGIGLALPGPFFRNEGRIALMTNFPGWEKVFIKDKIQSYFDLPVFLEQDANAGALAEWWFGSNSINKRIMIYVAAGQGIGAGIIIDGQIIRGALGTAGEIGHMSINFNGPLCECGNHGCLEYYCSTKALLREINKKLENYPNTTLTKESSLQSVFDAIITGDQLATKAFEEVAHYLGLGLVNIINIFNPDMIVIGDELTQIGPQLLNIVNDTIAKHTLPSINEKIYIKTSSLIRDSALIGASAVVTNSFLQKPSSFI